MAFLLFIGILLVIWFVYTSRTAYCNMKLFDYALSGDEYKVRELLRTNADVNMHEPNGLTPLMVAAQRGHMHIVKLLLDAGANPRLTDNRGYTAQAHALWYGHPEIAFFIESYK